MAWVVVFDFGNSSVGFKTNINYVRLVRSGQPSASFDSLAQAAVTLTSTSASFGTPPEPDRWRRLRQGAFSYAVNSAGTASCAITGGGTTLTATAAGTCTVTATKAADSNYNGASSSATTVTITTLNPPICTLTTSVASIKPGANSILSANCSPSATSYTWSTNTGFGSSTKTATVSPKAGTTYTVVGNNADGAGNTASVYVGVIPSCTLTATPNTITVGASATLQAICTPGATAFNWSANAANAAIAPTMARGKVSPVVDTDYSVSATSSDGTSDTVSVRVLISRQVDIRAYAPKANGSYTSFLRIINTGPAATPVTVAPIDGPSGVVGDAKVLISTLAPGAVRTLSSTDIEATLGLSWRANDWPRLRFAGQLSSIEVQSFVSGPNGDFSDVSGAQSGASVMLGTYLPAATNGYTSMVRIVNTGTLASSVSVAAVDPVTGTVGTSALLHAALPPGAAMLYSSKQIEAALGVPLNAAQWQSLLISAGNSTLDVQHLLVNPSGSLTEITGEQNGTSVDVRTYVPAGVGGYQSILRVTNERNGFPTNIMVSLIDDVSGTIKGSGIVARNMSPGATLSLTARQIEAVVGTVPALSRPRIRVEAVASLFPATLHVQSYLIQPDGTMAEASKAMTGTSNNVRTYVPNALFPFFTSLVRVINPGNTATPVSVAYIDPDTGVIGQSKLLMASLPAGGARTFISSEVEQVLGLSIAGGLRPRIQITGNQVLEVQSFLLQPSGSFLEVSGAQ